MSVHKDELLSNLASIAKGYDPSNPAEQFDYWLKRIQAGVLRPWLIGRHVVELGCATGELTSLLAPFAQAYDVIEGSESNVAAAAARVPGARFHRSLWEEFQPDTSYSDIVLFNAVEHAGDPVGLLRLAAGWLEEGGRIHIVVPNGLSLHRLLGVELGLMNDPLELTDGDRAQGHLRNYTIDSLQSDVARAGLAVRHWQGLFLKPLSNRQLLDWGWDRISAMHRVGQRFPHHCAELFLVAESAPAPA